MICNLPLILADDRGWQTALLYFDRGQRDLLATMVCEYMRAPEAMRNCTAAPSDAELDAVAKIITGKRKPRRGIRANLRRAEAVQTVKHLRSIRDAMKAADPLPQGWTRKRIAVQYSKAMEACAEQYRTTVETLESWVKPTGSKEAV